MNAPTDGTELEPAPMARTVPAPSSAAPVAEDGAQTGARGGRRCGTHTGYGRHRAAGEEACEPCKVAHAEHERRQRNRNCSGHDFHKAYSRARGKALVQLAQRHRAEYTALLYAARVKEGI